MKRSTDPFSRKRFGQHFLEPAWVEKMLRAIAPQAAETFVEIGPGRGALTRPLAARARRVIAFEIDRDLAAELRRSAPPNVTIVEGDFLDSGLSTLDPRLSTVPARVAGNLPYNVATPILFKLVDAYRGGVPIADATLMLQREVADRLVASPGTGDYGVLTIAIALHASVERVLSLPPGAFRPVPKVHSSLVRLRFHPPEPAPSDVDLFNALVQAAFTRRRKTLANALLAFPATRRLPPAEALHRAGLAPTRRPETVTLAEWVGLADVFASARAVL